MNAELAHRWLQFGQLVAGVLIVTVGAIQSAYSHPFRRDWNRALAALGVAGVLYGARLLIAQPDIRALVPASRLFWQHLDVYITYIVLVPILLFYELSFGSGWRQSTRWVRLAATAYAIVAIAIDSMTRVPGAAMGPNNYLAVVSIGVLLANSVHPEPHASRDVRIVRGGLLVLAAFVLFQNIVNDRFLEGEWNVEWAGVLALMGALGYVAVSTALENGRRLHELNHELETARQIQRSILPRTLPVVEDIDIAARYLPMTAVAGDFYDFIEIDAGRFGVLVADVSGHGVPAALIASMVKVALVAQSSRADDPALVLSGMNEIFCGRLERQFVTAVYVYIDGINGRLRYGAAGHPPALLVDHAGVVEEISENGVMLGHFPGWQYRSVERAFDPGDRLVLYTDGLVEATDAHDNFFDRERLRAFARNRSNGSAEVFASALVNHVSAWSKRTGERGFDDDVTVVVIERSSHGPRTP